MQAVEIPNSLSEISQNWVEMALQGDGKDETTLPTFQLQPLDANNSTIARLIFDSKPDKSSLPISLILKLCPNGHSFLGASEPNYYNRDYQGLTNGPIVKCLATTRTTVSTSESIGKGYVLFLEDLSPSYTDNKMIAPNEAHATHLGRALGKLHSHNWGRDSDPEGQHDLKAEFQRYLIHVKSGLEPILEYLGGELSISARSLLNRVFQDDAEHMLHRALQGNGLTLVHGDPNPTNVLTNNAEKDIPPLYIIDRQPFDWSLRLWLGASDLVYSAVPFWSVENRRALQKDLLVNYHETLLENGVKEYTWKNLVEDWKICTCMAAFTAIEWGSDPESLENMKWLWQRQLERAIAALEDCDAEW